MSGRKMVEELSDCIINTEDMGKYVSVTTHKNGDDIYDVIKINSERMDYVSLPKMILPELRKYFYEQKYKEFGVKRHILDTSDVSFVDNYGLNAVLECNNASKEQGNGAISLIYKANFEFWLDFSQKTTDMIMIKK